MREIDALVRNAYVSGDVTPYLEATIHRNYPTWTMQKLSSLLGSQVVSDDYYDNGHKALWFDADLNSSGNLICLATPASYGGNNAWYRSYDSTDYNLLVGGPSVCPFTRPGVIQDTIYHQVFYIGTDYKVYRSTILGATWGSTSAGYSLPATPIGGTVAPITATTCMVFAWTGVKLWCQYLTYNPGGDSWSASTEQTLFTSDSYYWQDATWFDAVAHPTDSNKIILTVPYGIGQSMSVVYSISEDIYSEPHFIYATPGDTWSCRVYVSGLSGPYNNRVWAVTTVDFGDTPYASHVRLLSSADGFSWRDEGYVTSYDMRGKLLITGTTMKIGSQSKYMDAYAIYRIAGTEHATYTEEVAMLNMALQHQGNGATPTLTFSTPVEYNELVYGAKMSLLIGATVTGNATGSNHFSGYVDTVEEGIEVGRLVYDVQARGSMSRLIGETAYKPMTTIDWKGRNIWHTDFQAQNVSIPAVAVYADEGYWWSEIEEETGQYSLLATAEGAGIVPMVIENRSFSMRIRCKTSFRAGIIWGISDDVFATSQRWEFGIYEDSIQINERTSETDTTQHDWTALSPAVDTEYELLLQVTPERIDGWVVDDTVAPSSWEHVSYVGWNPSGSSTAVIEPPYAVGIFAYPAEGEEARFYEISVCDSGVPLTIQDAISEIANIAGVSAVTHETTYSNQEFVPMRYIDFTLLTSMDYGTVDLFRTSEDYTSGSLTFFDTYAVLVDASINVRYIPFFKNLTGIDFPRNFRIVATGNFLSIYYCDSLLGCIYTPIPNYGTLIRPGIGYGVTVKECNDPVQSGDFSWIAWDANTGADSVLGAILQQRRIYLIEDSNGNIEIRSTSASGDTLIDDSNPVAGQTYYERSSIKRAKQGDIRNLVGVIAVTDTNGNRVFVIDPELAVRSHQLYVQDSAWSTNESDALKEAVLLRNDYRKRVELYELSGVWDPATEIGDKFSMNGLTGIVRGFTIEFNSSDNKIQHRATVNAEKYVVPASPGTWGTSKWGDFNWG